MSMIERFEAMLAAGKDNALLRFSLGNEYLKLDRAALAQTHLRAAVALDARYSAAWKLLGKCLAASGESVAAREAFIAGIDAAEAHGDKQAAKEMRVFLRRLDKAPLTRLGS
jgi:predicted Zn-dependent protease